MIDRIGPILSETELRRVWFTSACLAAILGRARPEVRMANIYIETLRKLRDVLVEQRRNTANEAARLITSDPQPERSISRELLSRVRENKARNSDKPLWNGGESKAQDHEIPAAAAWDVRFSSHPIGRLTSFDHSPRAAGL